MIFYLTNGSVLCGTQADARALDKDFVQIDIPVDKAGLMAFINDLYAQISIIEEYVPAPVREEISPEPTNVEVSIPLGKKIDSWFEPSETSRPIDKILAQASYTEALRINQLSVERMVVALVETRNPQCSSPSPVASPSQSSSLEPSSH